MIIVPICFSYITGAFLVLFIYKQLSPLSCINEIVIRADADRRKSGLPEKPFMKKVRRLNHITDFLLISIMIVSAIGIIGFFSLFFL